MFSFSHVYPTSLYKEGRKPRSVRTRILGVAHHNQILYLVMTTNSTEILLVGLNGKSTTVLSFKRYVEIICADISSDNDLLIYTERIPNGSRFSFRSVMYHLNSLSDIKAFEDNSPIISFFLPDINDISTQNAAKKEYIFLNITGNSITHFRAIYANKKLQIKHERLGVNLANCRSFFYDSSSKNNRLISAITRNNTVYFFYFGQNKYFYKTDFKLTPYETINFSKLDILNLSKNNAASNFANQNKSSTGFSIFNFSKDKNKNNGKDITNNIPFPTTITPEASIKLMNKYTSLPPELALLPSVPTNSPFFRFSTGNMHVIRLLPLSLNPNLKQSSNNDSIEAYSSSSSSSSSFCRDFAIIEQLYRGEEFPLAFSVTVVEKNYSRLIEVPNVQPDVPINYLSFDNLVFVFVLNSFVSMIDFTIFPPSIFFLPRCLCQGPQIESNGNQDTGIQSVSRCDISSTTGNFTVDLESGEVYHIEVSFKDIPDNININFSDRKVLKIFATLIARLPNNVSISSIFNKLPIDEIGTLVFFFQVLFQIGLSMDLTARPSSNPPKSNPPKSNPISASVKKITPSNLLSSSYNGPDHLASSFSSSSSASGGSITLASFEDISKIQSPNHFSHSQNQSQAPVQSQIPVTPLYRTYSLNSKPKKKHYGRTIHDLNDMRPPLSKEQLSMLEEMNREFPSLGRYTRIDSFLYILVQLKNVNSREREGPDIVIRHLQLQNRLSLIIRAGLDEWQRVYLPNDATKFILNASLLNEAKKSSAPSISCLELEVEAMADSICSRTLRNHLRYSAKLIGISRIGRGFVNNSKKSQNNNISNSTNSFSPITPPKSLTTSRRRTMTGSVTVFSSSARPIRGKRNSLASIQSNISTKRIFLGRVNSSSNFFKKLKSIELKSEKNQKIKKKSLSPQELFNTIRNHEELELKYWSSKLIPELSKDSIGFNSDIDSSIYETNSVALSKITESQWSRADSTFDSDGTSPDV